MTNTEYRCRICHSLAEQVAELQTRCEADVTARSKLAQVAFSESALERRIAYIARLLCCCSHPQTPGCKHAWSRSATQAAAVRELDASPRTLLLFSLSNARQPGKRCAASSLGFRSA